jgi:hypothetical protein
MITRLLLPIGAKIVFSSWAEKFCIKRAAVPIGDFILSQEFVDIHLIQTGGDWISFVGFRGIPDGRGPGTLLDHRAVFI